MSIRVMSDVWDHGPEDRGMVLVLLALADHADEDGRCYPGLERIARKARYNSVRGVQKVIRKLEKLGYVSTEIGAGPRGTNVYTVTSKQRECAADLTSDPRTAVHPEHSSPPEQGDTLPRTEGHETPNPGSPEPSGNINNKYISDAFEKLVKAHPRPSRLAESKNEFEKAVRSGVEPDAILKAASEYRERLAREGNLQFANSLLTWLQQRGWEATETQGKKEAAPQKMAQMYASRIKAGRPIFGEVPLEVQTEMVGLGCTWDEINSAMGR